MFTWLVSVALAGPVKIHSATPLTFRLDGESVGKLVTDISLPDVPEGAHKLDALDAFGQIYATLDFVVWGADPLWFNCNNHRFLQVDVELPKVVGERHPLSDAQYTWVEHRIIRKRKEDKKLKRLAEVVDRYWFEMRHVDKLLMAFADLSARVEAAKMLAPRTIDPQKTRAIEDHFPPGAFREQVLATFSLYQ